MCLCVMHADTIQFDGTFVYIINDTDISMHVIARCKTIIMRSMKLISRNMEWKQTKIHIFLFVREGDIYDIIYIMIIYSYV